MSWSLNIGKVFGTVVRIHLTFLLFLAWIFAASYASGGAAMPLNHSPLMRSTRPKEPKARSGKMNPLTA
jgi:hypothetical protein